MIILKPPDDWYLYRVNSREESFYPPLMITLLAQSLLGDSQAYGISLCNSPATNTHPV